MEGVIPLKKLVPIVVLCHFAIAAILSLSGSFSPERPLRESKLVVKTVKLTPKKNAPKQLIAEAPRPVEKPMPAAKPTPNPTPKPAPKPIPKALPKKPTPPSPTTKKQELLAKAVNNLKQAKEQPVVKSVKLPETSSYIEEEEEFNTGQLSYRDELIGRLKLLLKLPEYGLVKLRLTIGKGGEVAKIEILSSTSQKNKKHIEKTLPTLYFFPPGKNGDASGKISFLLTLSSD